MNPAILGLLLLTEFEIVWDLASCYSSLEGLLFEVRHLWGPSALEG